MQPPDPGFNGRAAPAAGANAAGAMGGQFVLPYVLLLALAWTIVPALTQTVPHADNVEQLNWAHAFQWGYIKHPPLPTWLLRAAIACFGTSALLTYALAMACVAATLLILWRCARRFLDERASLLALLLSSADYYLMGRGSFLNHNTVMLPFVAASAWAVLRIVQERERHRATPWLLLGLAQALGLLTKYQMAVVIVANATALLALGAWRRPRFAACAALAIAATLAPLVPHFLWLQQNAYSTFAYAGHSLLADLTASERVLHTLGFLVQQVGRMAPALLALALALLLQRRTMAPAVSVAPPEDDSARRALAILALVPLALVLALALLGGVAPQNHWGASTTLLLPLLAVATLAPARRPGTRAAIIAVVSVQLLAIAWNVAAARWSPGFHHRFAARPLAALALAHWQANTAGRLEVLIGPDWDAGAIALELPDYPAVVGSGDRRQAPWVSDAQIDRCGALVLWRTQDTPQSMLGAQLAARLAAPATLRAAAPDGTPVAIEAGIIKPLGAGCTEPP